MTEYTVKVGGRTQGKTLEVLKATQERAVALDKMLKAEQERAETLEILLFEFVRGRITNPAGHALDKSDDEILLKTFEIIKAGMDVVDFKTARQRLVRAQMLMQERSRDGEDENI